MFERLLSSAAVSEPLIGISFDRNPLLASSSGELTWGGINSGCDLHNLCNFFTLQNFVYLFKSRKDKFEGNFPEDFQNFQSSRNRINFNKNHEGLICQIIAVILALRIQITESGSRNGFSKALNFFQIKIYRAKK